MYSAVDSIDGIPAGFTRLVTLRTDGSNIRPLGSKRAGYDMYIRQSDGSVLDWLPDDEGAVLMARTYVPKIESVPPTSRMSVSAWAWIASTLRRCARKTIEAPRRTASQYITDGRGNVRIMASKEFDGTDRLTGITSFRYRAAGNRDWKDFGVYNSRTDRGIWPQAIEHSTDTVPERRYPGRTASVQAA